MRDVQQAYPKGRPSVLLLLLVVEGGPEMTKELFIKLYEKLGRDPTDDEMADAMADLIDRALMEYEEVRYLLKA